MKILTQIEIDTISKLSIIANTNKDFNLLPEYGVYLNVINRIKEVGLEQCKNDIDTEINALNHPNLWLKHLLIDIRDEF